jgi:hypothetical protein
MFLVLHCIHVNCITNFAMMMTMMIPLIIVYHLYSLYY